MIGEQNYVLWFMDAVREYGGDYEPFRDWGEPPKVITGRRVRLDARPVEVLKPRAARSIINLAHAGPLLETLKIMQRYGESYWKSPSGQLRRIFPRKGTNHNALWNLTGEKRAKNMQPGIDDSAILRDSAAGESGSDAGTGEGNDSPQTKSRESKN